MGYMVAAYTVVWGIIFGYVLLIGKRHNDLKKEIEFLKQLEK